MRISAKLGMWWRRVDGTLRKQLMIRRPNDVFVADMLKNRITCYNRIASFFTQHLKA